jgi:Type I phosphodiesterase / nucleotide pyrophosphatase
MRASEIGVTLLVLAACGGPQEQPRAPGKDAGPAAPLAADAGAVPTARSPFVVAIIVDQLSAWVAASRFPELPKDGGFARLIGEGTWVKTMRYPYAVTDTAPGHTSLHTGRVPAESGIFGNELPGPIGGYRISVLRDETVRAVGAEGVRQSPGSSAARLRVDTVADRLRAAHPDALVVSISVKDRGAILPAGKHPTHVLWFDSWIDSFVTSTAFTDTYPRWARGVGDPKAIIAARARPWELTDAAWVKAHAATPDNAPGEGDLDGLGITFPHVGKTGNTFRGLPAGDAMIAELGLAAIGAEYDPARPTLLLLSFSASDVVGHVFGPDSWEAWDHLLKLDTVLAAVIESLDRRVGAPVSFVLAADHGNISMPEVAPERAGVKCGADPYERPCSTGTRLGPNALRDELIVAMKTTLGPGDWVRGLADPYVFLTPAARALPEPRRALLDRTLRTTLAKHPAIAEVLDVRTLQTQCPVALARALGVPDRARAGEDVLTLVCRSWSDGVGAGDYYVIPRPGSFFDGEIVAGKGTSHGTPYLYDRTVFMLIRAPGVVDAGAVVDDPVDFAAFAAVESALVGLDTRAPRDILAAHRAKATAKARTTP